MNKFKHMLFLCIMLCATVVFTGCSKDDDKDTTPTTVEGNLTSGTWKASKEIWDGEESPITGTIRFNTNGTYNVSIDGDTDNGTWELNSEKTHITFDDEWYVKIKTLDAKNLQILDEMDDYELHFVK